MNEGRFIINLSCKFKIFLHNTVLTFCHLPWPAKELGERPVNEYHVVVLKSDGLSVVVGSLWNMVFVLFEKGEGE